MSTSFKLGLPTDIPWRRRCVTTDMVDRVVCDRTLPPKWQSSIALFEYTPPEEFQEFPDYDISYLKATVTITGYQALDDEIQGRIDWDGLDVSVIDGVTEMLESYWPCTGAILQVVCGPHDERPLSQYPFFMDFEPKKRELYEMATDTKERQSRSLESLNVGTSSASTSSLEVLDVDMGGSVGFGAEGSYAGTGGGFTYSSSNSGQWGTKALNSDVSQSTRTTELASERRETQSHTTQLSQMYHLLDSYHLGTNRAVFFVQPRPHVLEEPSGFVRGPRKVEGIQEFLLVVANPKDAGELCFSARLDTAHLVQTDVLDYETRTELVPLASASARIPTRNDQPAGTTTREACFIGCWDVTYHCFATHDVDDVVYPAPAGFEIVGFTDVVPQDASHGSTSVTVAPDRRSLTVHAEATGRICFEGSEVCVDCPDEVDKWAGYARRQVRAELRSIDRTQVVGSVEQLLITTRGLCCCDARVLLPPGGILDIAALPPALRDPVLFRGRAGHVGQPLDLRARGAVTGGAVRGGHGGDGPGGHCACQEDIEESPAHRVRRVNAVSDFVRERLARNLRVRQRATLPASILETDLFAKQMEAVAASTVRGRAMLSEPVELDDRVARYLGEALQKQPNELNRRDVLRLRAEDIARNVGADVNDVARAKLAALGVPVVPAGHERDGGAVDAEVAAEADPGAAAPVEDAGSGTSTRPRKRARRNTDETPPESGR